MNELWIMNLVIKLKGKWLNNKRKYFEFMEVNPNDKGYPHIKLEFDMIEAINEMEVYINEQNNR